MGCAGWMMGGNGQLRDRLLRFVALIEAANPVYRLVDADRRRLITHHLLDSLAAVPALRAVEPRATLLDVGSGAGLPGIPLALALTESRVILVERNARRAAFLNHVRRELVLTELTVIGRPLAEAALASSGCGDLPRGGATGALAARSAAGAAHTVDCRPVPGHRRHRAALYSRPPVRPQASGCRLR